MLSAPGTTSARSKKGVRRLVRLCRPSRLGKRSGSPMAEACSIDQQANPWNVLACALGRPRRRELQDDVEASVAASRANGGEA